MAEFSTSDGDEGHAQSCPESPQSYACEEQTNALRSAMLTVEARKRIALKNILFLTDFSEPSAAALPFATMIARSYGAKVTALHILLPSVYQAKVKLATVADDQEDLAIAEMERVEAELVGIQIG